MKTEKAKLIRVLLADDHYLVRDGFPTSLANQGIEVIGQTKTPDDAVKKYKELMPDVLVLDIKFGERLIGLDAGKEVLSRFPDAKIVFLSQWDQDPLVKEVYKMGALAFVSKESEPIELATAIKAAYQGKTYFPAGVTEKLVHLAIRGDTSPTAVLDIREIEIFKLMAKGLNNAEIAVKMGLSTKTISNTSQSIKDKLGVSRSAELALLAVRHGLIKA